MSPNVATHVYSHVCLKGKHCRNSNGSAKSLKPGTQKKSFLLRVGPKKLSERSTYSHCSYKAIHGPLLNQSSSKGKKLFLVIYLFWFRQKLSTKDFERSGIFRKNRVSNQIRSLSDSIQIKRNAQMESLGFRERSS